MDVKPEVEDKMVRGSIDKLKALTGKIPNGELSMRHPLTLGFFTDRRSNATIKLYAQAMADKGLPLLYSSDSCSDDLPFWTKSPVAGDEKGILMVPLS